MTAKDIMSKDVVSIAPEKSLTDAIHKLYLRGISGMPVCNEFDVVLGIVSERDLLAAQNAIVARKTPVSLVMTTPALTVSEDTPLKEIITVFVREGVKQLLVVRRGHAVGMVTRLDVLRAIVNVPAIVG